VANKLVQGADPHQRDTHGNTPLSVAIREKFQSIAINLLKHKADIFAKDSSNCYPFDGVPNAAFLFEILQSNPELVPRLKVSHRASNLLIPLENLVDFLANNTYLVELHFNLSNVIDLTAEIEIDMTPAQVAAAKEARIRSYAAKLSKNLTLTSVVLCMLLFI